MLLVSLPVKLRLTPYITAGSVCRRICFCSLFLKQMKLYCALHLKSFPFDERSQDQSLIGSRNKIIRFSVFPLFFKELNLIYHASFEEVIQRRFFIHRICSRSYKAFEIILWTAYKF